MIKEAHVREWMTADPIAVGVDTPIVEAHQLMTEHNIRRLPVVDGKKLVGIVTLGDLRGAEPSDATSLSIWELNFLLHKMSVGEIMAAPVHTIAPDQSVGDAAKLMLDKKIAGLPVMEQDELVGIITESDIFRLLVTECSPESETAAQTG